jgi:hypothetical protein
MSAEDAKRKGPQTWLAQQVRAYGIKPRTVRTGERVVKGYVQEEFPDTFRRYIQGSEVEAMKRDLAERTVRYW